MKNKNDCKCNEQETLILICKTLNEVTNTQYSLVLKSPANSIDFITDSKVKHIVGIITTINQIISIELQSIPYYEDGTLAGIDLNLVLVANIKDFTADSDLLGVLSRYLIYYRGRLNNRNERFWIGKIKKLNQLVVKCKKHLIFEFIPSRRLSLIVGKEPKTKYEIFNRLSEYIFSNNLKLSDGTIKLDKTMSSWFNSSKPFVNEDDLFDFLTQNSLLTEYQINKFIKSHGNYNGHLYQSHNSMAQLKTSSRSSEYLFGPIT